MPSPDHIPPMTSPRVRRLCAAAGDGGTGGGVGDRRRGALVGIVEDDPIAGGTLAHRLELEGYEVVWWQTGAAALTGIRTRCPELVVCDILLPDVSGEDVFLNSLPVLTGTPFLFVTAYGQIDQAVRLTKAGAVDYIAKPYALGELLDRIPRLLGNSPHAAGALGESPAMRRIETLLRRVAEIDTSLLLTGESGTGKEVAARFVHQISSRSSAPFMAVNCAAIPSDLIENELFGHERGAFTGAHQRHEGYVERARKGVLFLDEVGDLPLPAQAKLLRLVQERAFTRLGGETVVKSTARLICATNADLERAVEGGWFRQDLYYRINVIPVSVPPLRERPEDILSLAHGFAREFADTFGQTVHGFTPTAEHELLSHAWPGNVRELRNRLERAVALSDGPWIGRDALFPGTSTLPAAASEDMPTLSEVRDVAERRHIRLALDRASGRVDEAARSLGISRSTLFEKMRKLGLRSDESAGPD
jgi:DNA-binding NtrC family response regulator